MSVSSLHSARKIHTWRTGMLGGGEAEAWDPLGIGSVDLPLSPTVGLVLVAQGSGSRTGQPAPAPRFRSAVGCHGTLHVNCLYSHPDGGGL